MKLFKSFGCLLALLLAAIILLPSRAMAVDVAINSTNFPDKNFRNYVSENIDKDGNGKLSATEIKNRSSIDVSGLGIKSLKGVELLTSLTNVRCANNELTELTIGANWIGLDCSNNKLTELKITPGLCWIDCYGNNIKVLDVKGNIYFEIACDPDGYYADKTETDEYIEYSYYEFEEDDLIDYTISVDKTTAVVYQAPKFKSQPKDKETKKGKKVSFSAWAEGGNMSYQWYYKKPGDTTWTKVTSESGKTYKLTFYVAERHYGYQYRCIASNYYGKTTSSAATLYGPIKITTQPKDVMVKKGAKATIKVVAEGDSALSYKWMVSDPGDTKYYTSAKKATYSHVMEKAEENGRKAYCVITDEDGNSIQTITVTLRYVTAKPKITSPTAATTKTVAKGKTATFTVKTGVKTKAGFTYQWQYRTSSSGTWKNVSAASGKTASYKLTVAKKHNGYQYRCKVTNPYGTTISKIFTLKVTS